MSRDMRGRYAVGLRNDLLHQMEKRWLRTENLEGGRHVVQFYGHDEELADRVTGYLLGALGRDGVAIVIATPEHRREFETRLGQAGVDLRGRPGQRRVPGPGRRRDATRVHGRAANSDRVAFDRVIGGLIRRAAAGGRPVRAYGEMVALLWDDGLVSAAVQLEAMWDELGRSIPVLAVLRLPDRLGDPRRYLDAFAEVCRLHREIVGSPGPGTGRDADVRLLPRRARGGPPFRGRRAARVGGRRTSPMTPPWW